MLSIQNEKLIFSGRFILAHSLNCVFSGRFSTTTSRKVRKRKQYILSLSRNHLNFCIEKVFKVLLNEKKLDARGGTEIDFHYYFVLLGFTKPTSFLDREMVNMVFELNPIDTDGVRKRKIEHRWR